jgi:membrane protease YdiL (CAAX protease family)
MVPPASDPVVEPALSPARPWWRVALFGPHGLRAGWSLLLFLALFIAVGLVAKTIVLALHLATEDQAWTAGFLIAVEAVSFTVVLLLTALLGRIEKRLLATYGFDLRRAFGGHFWEGALWGFLAIAAVIAMMAAAGAYRVDGLAIHGRDLLSYAVAWLVATLLVGLAEELLFRGFTLFTLARGLGFWPGALLLSLYFGWIHYQEKPMETWLDFASVSLIGLFFCFTVRRTGDLWFAIGWHTTYNYGSLFVFGGPNTGNQGQPVAGHLLASSFHGPDWLTGGPMGPEASALIFVVIAALFALFHRRYPTARFPRLEATPARAGRDEATPSPAPAR